MSSMSTIPSQHVLLGIPAFATFHNQRHSPLLKLSAELRNAIFTYAFQGHVILVRRLAGENIIFRVQPQDVLNTRRYPLSDLFARAKACRQIYKGTAGLIMRPNTFRLDHNDCINLFVERLYPWKLGQVKSVTLGMPLRDSILGYMLESGLRRLENLIHVVVDMKGRAAYFRSRERRERFALVLMTCIGEFLDVGFV